MYLLTLELVVCEDTAPTDLVGGLSRLLADQDLSVLSWAATTITIEVLDDDQSGDHAGGAAYCPLHGPSGDWHVA